MVAKRCPKCAGIYPNDFKLCPECNIEIVDIKDFTYANRNLEHEEFLRNHKDDKFDKAQLQKIHQQQLEQERQAEIERNKNCVPRCPICNSTNLSKITTTKKAAKIALFGIFGMGDNGKTFKCNNCGAKF